MIKCLHVSTDFENVYEPAEDSFILLDALEIEIRKIQELKPTFALEIGPGSGIISSAIANITVNEKQLEKLCYVFSCDINVSACKATQRTAYQNNVSSNVGVVCSNLLQALIHRFKQNIDLGKCTKYF
jgi:release factor glutamine methyltransferase